MKHSLLTMLALGTALSALRAQTTGSYTLYGNGCAGSGAIPGGVVVPKGYATTAGTSANSYPWGYYNLHYMQSHDAADFPGTTLIRGFNLRNRQNYAQNAYVLNITLSVGYTSSPARTLNTTYASNWLRTPTVVFNGGLNVPSFAAQTTPTVWTVAVPFSVPMIYSPQIGNFLWEVVNTTASAPTPNFFDAVSSSTVGTCRLFGAATATTGSIGSGYGVIVQLVGAGSTGAIVSLTNTGVPAINKSFSVNVSGAVTNSVAVLWLGAQKLNLSLGSALPGCTLYSSTDILLGGVATGTTGSGSMNFTLPNVQSYIGIRYYNQFMVLDPNANAVGLVLSNGGEAVIGS